MSCANSLVCERPGGAVDARIPAPLTPPQNQPVLRDRLFFGGIALGVLHGFNLIARSLPDEE